MFIIWIIAFIPMVVAGILYAYNKRVNLHESIGLTVIGLIVSGIFQFFVVRGMTSDVEIWSGQVTEARYVPPWTEYYEEAIYRTEYYTETEYYTDSKGNSQSRTVTKSREVFSHYEPRTAYHSEYYKCNDNLGFFSYTISKDRYDDIKNCFGEIIAVVGDRTTGEHASRLLSGDPMDYVTVNKNNYVYPVSENRNWENKIKASPSVFSFPKVPDNIFVYDYPETTDKFSSNRLLGAVPINLRNFDQLNAELGFSKRVNIIIINMGNVDSMSGEWQKAKWIGGKKNDIVICYGGGTNNKPKWVKTFGWSDSEIVKVKLDSIILKNGVSNSTLPLIKDVIQKEYNIKDWSKFDYLTVEIPFSKYMLLLLIQTLVCGGWILFAILNDNDKEVSFIKSYKNYYH